MLDCKALMNTEVQKIIRLHNVDEEILHRSEDAAKLPKRLAVLEAALAAENQVLTSVKQEIAKEEETRLRIDESIQAQLTKLKRFREKAGQVTTNEQLTAIEKEISFAETEIKRLEDEQFASLSRAEALEDKQTASQKSVHQQQIVVDSERVQIQVAETVHHARIQMLKKQREAIRAEINPELLATYDRAATSHHCGAAGADERICHGCQMSIRPQLWNQIRDGELANCESCGRILYWAPLRETKPPASVSPSASGTPSTSV